MSAIAIVGATGAVGRTMVSILEQRDFPVTSLRLMASSRSAGAEVDTKWGTVTIEDLDQADPSGLDIAMYSAGGDRSRAHAPRFAEAGVVVVDNSSAFRMRDGVPLVVVDVNDHAIAGHSNIIANPNCTTMNVMMAAGPLHSAFGLTSMVVSSYQAVSGSGHQGTAELVRQNEALGKDPDALVSGEWIDPGSEVYTRPIAWNVLPFAGSLGEQGYTDEEWKLVFESRKILDLGGLAVEPTCVRVPVIAGHGIAATMRFAQAVDVAEAAAVLEAAPGLELWADETPTALDSAGRDEVLAGRLRPTIGEPGGLNVWVVGDNLRKGAALNAVQIAEALL
ncbi:MAG: aspartate-semialdehyde dehydrogenase [Acidimicrobiia bacterium]